MPSIIGDLYETGRDRDNIDREIQKIKERLKTIDDGPEKEELLNELKIKENDRKIMSENISGLASAIGRQPGEE